MAAELTFTASTPLYRLDDRASQEDVFNQLGARLAQLDAMLAVVTGGGSEAFSSCVSRIQADYLWACQSIASECKELADRITTKNLGAEE